VNNVYVIIIEDNYPKLSSFCVIPNEAFGWGLAAQYETNYQWPKTVKDTTITNTENAIVQAENIAKEYISKKMYDAVWVVSHDQVEIIK
jgi:hypothetical protein